MARYAAESVIIFPQSWYYRMDTAGGKKFPRGWKAEGIENGKARLWFRYDTIPVVYG